MSKNGRARQRVWALREREEVCHHDGGRRITTTALDLILFLLAF